jgi:hypothetical protein
MIFRPFFDFEHGCAAYLFGCGGHGLCAVVDAREPESRRVHRLRTRQRHAHHPRDRGRAAPVHTSRRWAGNRPREHARPAARENAVRLYSSLHEKLLTLPDEVEVYPAHFGGSACGAGLSGKPSSTIGFERRFNHALSLEPDAFLDAVGVVTPKPLDSEAVLEFNRGRAIH